LSRKGFVHRDLAARNVLVCEGKLVKIADFGLSRNVCVGKVYHCAKTRKLPVKWMSLEAIHDQVFTAESDV
jgi:serine/threonine protein kinase